MGIRYHITLVDMQALVAAGVATLGKKKPHFEEEWDEKYHSYMPKTFPDFYIWEGSVGTWQFNAYSDDGRDYGGFSGPNWGKDDLDDIFETYGIKPEYW